MNDEEFHNSITAEMDRLLNVYSSARPELESDVQATLREGLAKCGLAAEWFDKIEELAV